MCKKHRMCKRLKKLILVVGHEMKSLETHRMEERSPTFIMMNEPGWTTVTSTKKKSIKNKDYEPLPSPSPVKPKHVAFKDEVGKMRKLDAATEPFKPKTLSLETRQEIINRRVSKLWTQADLNKYCSFPANTIREIESGRTPPTSNQLSVLNRILKGGLHYS